MRFNVFKRADMNKAAYLFEHAQWHNRLYSPLEFHNAEQYHSDSAEIKVISGKVAGTVHHT